jgi:hypothetical protein
LTSALISRSAINVTIENNPKSAGVVRAIARSLHCLWVSIPKSLFSLDEHKEREFDQRRHYFPPFMVSHPLPFPDYYVM